MRKIIVLALLISTMILASCDTNKTLDNEFYAFNTSMFLPNAPKSFIEKIELIKKTGYDGLGSSSQYYFEQKKAMDSLNFRIPEVYTLFNIDRPQFESIEAHIETNLKEVIHDLKGSSTIISLALISKSRNDTQNKDSDEYIAKQLQLLADYAANYDVHLSIYPHVNTYCEKIEHTLKIVTLVDRSNLGMAVNLCHMLKVEGEDGYEGKIKKALPFVKMVSISGADTGDTRSMNWKRLIQTLGEGTFDTYSFVKNLKDMGYDGMIGLQCFGIRDEFEDSLTKSMNSWREYQALYNQPANSDY